MITLKQINNCNTIQDLQELEIGELYYDIGYRGGGVGFYAADVAGAIGVSTDDLPNKFGAGCNYLGGGVRGSVFASDFNNAITGRKEKLLRALALACVRAYKETEAEAGINDEYNENRDNFPTSAY